MLTSWPGPQSPEVYSNQFCNAVVSCAVVALVGRVVVELTRITEQEITRSPVSLVAATIIFCATFLLQRYVGKSNFESLTPEQKARLTHNRQDRLQKLFIGLFAGAVYMVSMMPPHKYASLPFIVLGSVLSSGIFVETCKNNVQAIKYSANLPQI